ncbi:hypothetical protein H5410_030162 [Solanum commersonii]|uniref:RING-type domain-containing protein n=1 Tax=Solanum commersonii TaxID=4109 RepID=A0A9J5YGN6_SOLCO|nr:hypothetical protein H5410_030162 [Solanum commersonii]
MYPVHNAMYLANIIFKGFLGQKWAIKRRGQANLCLFPRLSYSDIELGDRDTTCRICLSDFESTDNIYILPCTHLYHSECIST